MSREAWEYLLEGLGWPELADEARNPRTWAKAAGGAALAFAAALAWTLLLG